MNDKDPLTPREAMLRKRASLLEEAAAKEAAAAEVERDIAELDRLTTLAAKYNLVLTEAEKQQVFDQSMGSLVHLYKTDDRSPYQQLRHKTRETYGNLLKRIVNDCGNDKLPDFKAQFIQRLYDGWSDGGKKSGMGHGVITMLRGVINFGATILEDSECERVSVVLHNMSFTVVRRQNERLNAEHATEIIRTAHRLGHSSIALAQAFQFDCRLSQKDVIGEWVPAREPEISDVLSYGEKWLRGLRWNEINKGMVLRHITSVDGKMKEFRLSEAPLVMAELNRIGVLPQSGPIVIRDGTDLPWQSYDFRRVWRQVATAAGVPKNVKNMDSRSRRDKSQSRNDVTLDASDERVTEGESFVARR